MKKHFILIIFSIVFFISLIKTINFSNDSYNVYKSEIEYIEGYAYDSCGFGENKIIFVFKKNPLQKEKILLLTYKLDDVLKEKLKAGVYIKIKNPSKYIIETKEARNFGEFDQKKYFAGKKILFQIMPVDDSIEIIGFKPNFNLISAKVRTNIYESLNKALGENFAGIAMAIITGDTAGISQNEMQEYRGSGIAHILAVSGMHVGFIQNVIYKIFSRKKIHYTIRNLIVVIFLVIFASIADFSPSVTRAMLQANYMLMAKVLKRPAKRSNSLFFAGTLQLLYNPYLLFNNGFVLSYIAAASMLVIQPVLLKKIFFFGKIPALLVPGISVNIGLFPMLVTYFNSFSPIGIIATIFAGKASYVICLSGLAVWITSVIPFGSYIMKLPASISSFAIFCINKISETGSGIPPPLGAFKVPRMKIYAIIIYYLFIIMLINKKYCMRFKKRIICICVVVAIIFSFVIQINKTEIVFFDVGQGLSALYKSNGMCGLVDTGEGEIDISTLLYKEGVGTLDFVLLTHGHSDHVGGFEKIAAEHKIKMLFVPDNVKDEGIQEACNIAQKHNINIIKIQKHYYCKIGSVELSFYLNQNAIQSDNINNTSLVMIAKSKDANAVFTGDIEAETENYLVDSGYLTSADILQVAHHGSETSTLHKNISIISPLYAIISVGENNGYGHPSDKVLNTLEASGATIKRSDKCGAVRIIARKGNFRVWQKLKT